MSITWSWKSFWLALDLRRLAALKQSENSSTPWLPWLETKHSLTKKKKKHIAVFPLERNRCQAGKRKQGRVWGPGCNCKVFACRPGVKDSCLLGSILFLIRRSYAKKQASCRFFFYSLVKVNLVEYVSHIYIHGGG